MRLDEVTFETIPEYSPNIGDVICVSIGGNKQQEMRVVEVSEAWERYSHGDSVKCIVRLKG